MTPISALPAAEFDEKRREVMYGLRTHGASGLSLDAHAIIERQAAELSNVRSSLNDARSSVTELDDALGEADARCANLRADLAECTARHNEAVMREVRLRAALEKARPHVQIEVARNEKMVERGWHVPAVGDLAEIDAALGKREGE